ncbi:M16 family metallopeptidase [Nannocystaceae bacterium ST9]
MNDPERRITQLDCGLVVIAQRIPALAVASTQCWVKAGSIYQGELSQGGVSHFLEHVLARGATATRTAAQSAELLARLGAQTNAYTGLDTVHYLIDTAADDVRVAIELLSDWMQHARISPEEFACEREVIQTELASGGDPSWVLWQLTLHARYALHPARHPAIGHLDQFLALTREDLRRYYEAMYAPNNMVFVVAGDVDPGQIVDWVAQAWAEAAPRSVPLIALPIEAPPSSPRHSSGYAAVAQPRLRLAWPGARLGSPADHALDVLARVLGQGALCRLARLSQGHARPLAGAEAYNLSYPWGEGCFGVDAVLRSEAIDEARHAIVGEVERIRAEGVTPDELVRAQRKLVATEVFAAQTVRGAASRIARDFIQSGDPDYLYRYADSIRRVEAAAVRDAAIDHLRPDRLLTIQLLPESKRRVESPAQHRVEPDREPLAVEQVTLDNGPLMQEMRRLGRFAIVRGAGDVARLRRETLANGLRVIVQRDQRMPTVAMRWHLLGGLASDEPGREGVANAVNTMSTRGAGRHSAAEISRMVEELGASLTTTCTHSTSSVKAECLEADFATMLALMGDVIQRPHFPANEWATLSPRLQAAIARQNETWTGHLRTGVGAAYFGSGHPWSKMDFGSKEVVAGLDRVDLERFHADHLAASDGVLAIFGDVDEDKAFAAASRQFEAMPERPRIPLALPVVGALEAKRVHIASDKPLAAVQLAYGPGLTRRCSDHPALAVMNKVLDSPPNGWLDQELRGRGLVYVVGAGMMAGAAPGYWGVMFNCRPCHVREATDRTLAVLDRIRTERIEQATLERAQNGALVSEALGLQSNAQRATGAALDELLGFGFDHGPTLRDAIRSVEPEHVRAVARRYLDTLVQVEISPNP